MLSKVRDQIQQITDVGLSLLALGIVASLIGPNVPFLGAIADNIVSLINSLGNEGVVGLVAAGVIIWLFRN